MGTVLSQLVILPAIGYEIVYLTIVVLAIPMQLVGPGTITAVVQFVVHVILTAVGWVVAVAGWVIGATIVALVLIIATAITALRVFVVPAAIAVLEWTIAAVGWVILATIGTLGSVIAASVIAVVSVIAGIVAVWGSVVALVEWVVPATIASAGSGIDATLAGVEWVIAQTIVTAEWINASTNVAVGWIVSVVDLVVSPTIAAAASVTAAIIVGVEWVVAVVRWVIVATITALGRVIYAITATVVESGVSWVGSLIASLMADWEENLFLAFLVVIVVLLVFLSGGVTATWQEPQVEIPTIPAPSRPAPRSVVQRAETRPGPSRFRNAGVLTPTRLAAAPSAPGSLNRLAEEASILLELFSQGSHDNDNISDEYHRMITNATEGVLAIHARIRQVNQRAVSGRVSIPDPDCIICYGERADTLFMPCRHLVVCTVYMSSASRSLRVVANRVVRAVVW